MPEAYESKSEKVFVIEVYVPSRLQYLSDFYQYLESELKSPRYAPLFEGFSLYEVKGAFRGRNERIYEEPTLVLRLVFDQENYFSYGLSDDTARSLIGNLEPRIMELARQAIAFTDSHEEEIWILKYEAERIRLVRREG